METLFYKIIKAIYIFFFFSSRDYFIREVLFFRVIVTKRQLSRKVINIFKQTLHSKICKGCLQMHAKYVCMEINRQLGNKGNVEGVVDIPPSSHRHTQKRLPDQGLRSSHLLLSVSLLIACSEFPHLQSGGVRRVFLIIQI